MLLMRPLDYVAQSLSDVDDGKPALVGRGFDSTAAVVAWPGMGSVHGSVEALHCAPVEGRVLEMSSHIRRPHQVAGDTAAVGVAPGG
jgi:hypothetical protein